MDCAVPFVDADNVLCTYASPSADMLHVLWEDASEPPDSLTEGRGGLCVADLVDVVPSALSARLQTRTALTLSMSLVTNNDGCFDFLALSQEDWDCWYVGLRFLAETSEPLLQPLQSREDSPQPGAPEQQQRGQSPRTNVRDGNHTTFYVDSSDFGEEEDHSSRATVADDAVPVAGLHELVPILQDLQQRMLAVQKQQSDLIVCHQEALMMLADAQAAQVAQAAHAQQQSQVYAGERDQMADSIASGNQQQHSHERALCRRIEELEQLSEVKESTISVLQQLLATVVCDSAT